MLWLLLLAVAQAPAESKPKIEEIQVSDLNVTITLRADGTGEYRYQGRLNLFASDERTGYFTGTFNPKHFQRIALLLHDVDIEALKDHRLGFPMRVSRLSIKRGGKTKIIEIHERGLESDPEPPDRLWTLMMVVKGFATTVNWEPVTTGLRVHFKSGGPFQRQIVVRDPDNQTPVVQIRSKSEMVDFPIKQGKYSVEYQNEVDGKWSNAVKISATVEEGKFSDVIVEKQ